MCSEEMWIVTTSSLRSRRIAVPNASASIQDYYEAQGWTDGLPRGAGHRGFLVWEMLGTFGRDPAQNLGVIQPRNASVTLEKIAVIGDGGLPPGALSRGGRCRPRHLAASI